MNLCPKNAAEGAEVGLSTPALENCKTPAITYHTKSGSKNCITMTKPKVTKISPKFRSNIRQQMPFVFGQNGFGADIVSMVMPGFLVIFVFTVDTSEGAGGPLRYE